MSSVELDELAATVARVTAAPATELSGPELAGQVLTLRKLADIAEAAYLDRLHAFDRRAVGEDAQALSTVTWLRHHAHIAPGEARRSVKVAHGVARFPAVATALAAGEIRVPHATAIVDGATLLGHDVVADCEEALVDAARRDDPSRLRAALRGYGAAVDNPDAVKRAERHDLGRWLDLATGFQGTVTVQGSYGTEDGSIVRTAVDSLAAPASADDDRTPSQRRADALVEICRRHLRGPGADTQHGHGRDRGDRRDGAPAGRRSRGRADTHISPPAGRHTVHDIDPDLAGGTGAAGPDEAVIGRLRSTGEAVSLVVVTDLATIEARSGGFGELPDGNVLRGETVRRLACNAGITRVITGPDSMPLDVGRVRRLATTAQRKALRIRDRGCRWPGCDRPPEWTEVHHLTRWVDGGRTDLDDMMLLCRKHHRRVHEGGWRIHRLDCGQSVFTDPDGHPFAGPANDTTSAVVRRLVEVGPRPARAGPPP